MSLSIGRAGLNPALVEVSRYEFDGGGQVKLSGWIRGSTSKDMLVAVREQMLGLVDNPDESVVPLVWGEDPSLDGFYRVRQIGMGSEPRMKLDSRSVIPWDATLERVSSYAYPQFDSRLLHALRSGSEVTSASASAIQGLAPATTVYRRGSTVLGGLDSRASADGDVYVNTWATSSAQASAEWQGPAEGFYDGAATIERRIDGGPWVPVVGQTFAGDVDPNTEWRLSNGLVAVIPNEAVGTSTGHITVLSWGGTGYESSVAITPLRNGSGFSAFGSLSILRNSPECVTVRLLYYSSGNSLDLTLRRGDRNVQGVFRDVESEQLRAYLTDGASTVSGLTGALRRDSNDADGNRWVLSSALGTFNTDAVGPSYESFVEVASGTVLDFGFGHEIGGSSATGIDTAQALANQYAAYVSERVDVANP